jgi:hypothetical protein
MHLEAGLGAVPRPGRLCVACRLTESRRCGRPTTRTIKDSEFVAELKSKNILFARMSFEALHAYVDKFMKTPPARIGRREQDLL